MTTHAVIFILGNIVAPNVATRLLHPDPFPVFNDIVATDVGIALS